MPPFLCRSALLTLCALLVLLVLSVTLLLAVIHLQSSPTTSSVTVSGQCRPRPPVIDLTLPLWQIPLDFVVYEILGHRYAEHACCDDDETSKT